MSLKHHISKLLLFPSPHSPGFKATTCQTMDICFQKPFPDLLRSKNKNKTFLFVEGSCYFSNSTSYFHFAPSIPTEHTAHTHKLANFLKNLIITYVCKNFDFLLLVTFALDLFIFIFHTSSHHLIHSN